MVQGNSLSMVQEMPISKPFSASEIDRLVDTKEVTALSPFYVDLQVGKSSSRGVEEGEKLLISEGGGWVGAGGVPGGQQGQGQNTLAGGHQGGDSPITLLR